MKKHIGSMAGFLAIMAVVFHTVFPLGPEAGGSRLSQKKTGSEIAGAFSPREATGLEGPWLATRTFFNSARKASAPITFEDVKPLLTWHALPDHERAKWRGVLGLPPDAHKTPPDVHKTW